MDSEYKTLSGGTWKETLALAYGSQGVTSPFRPADDKAEIQTGGGGGGAIELYREKVLEERHP